MDRTTPFPAPISSPAGPLILSHQPGTGSFQVGTTGSRSHENEICNLHEYEDLNHFLVRCPIYESYGNNYMYNG